MGQGQAIAGISDRGDGRLRGAEERVRGAARTSRRRPDWWLYDSVTTRTLEKSILERPATRC